MDASARARNIAITAMLKLSGSRIPRYLSEFRQLEHATPMKSDDDQGLRLLSLLTHAASHVPYYRKLLRDYEVVRANHIDLDRFHELPILTKNTILTEGTRLLSDDQKRRGAFENTSGGSTGAPVRFVQDREFYCQSVVAAKIIYNEYLGKLACFVKKR